MRSPTSIAQVKHTPNRERTLLDLDVVALFVGPSPPPRQNFGMIWGTSRRQPQTGSIPAVCAVMHS